MTGTGQTETGASYERQAGAHEHARFGAPTRADTDSGIGMGGTFAILAGVVSFLLGLAMVVRSHFYPHVTGYAYTGTIWSWGLALLIIGGLLAFAGACYLLGLKFARWLGVALAALTTVTAFVILPYSPIFAIIIVGLSLAAIWGLLYRNGSGVRAGAETRAESETRSGSMRM